MYLFYRTYGTYFHEEKAEEKAEDQVKESFESKNAKMQKSL